MNLQIYQTWVFDCDGVILNSNEIKTRAFYDVAKAYGESAAQAIVAHHISHGGISRYAKFERFLLEIVGRARVDAAELEQLLRHYAEKVTAGLAQCEIAPGLEKLREQSAESKWLVVSGSDEQELQQVFRERNLAHLFDGGIYGSPDTKDDILNREIAKGRIAVPAVFLGDSQYDYEAATRAGLDFIFVSGWSESAFRFDGAVARVDHLAALL